MDAHDDNREFALFRGTSRAENIAVKACNMVSFALC